MNRKVQTGAEGRLPQSQREESEWVHRALLRDSDGNPASIRSVRGAEAGLDHLEIITQSPREQELGISSRHRIFSEEI